VRTAHREIPWQGQAPQQPQGRSADLAAFFCSTNSGIAVQTAAVAADAAATAAAGAAGAAVARQQHRVHRAIKAPHPPHPNLHHTDQGEHQRGRRNGAQDHRGGDDVRVEAELEAVGEDARGGRDDTVQETCRGERLVVGDEQVQLILKRRTNCSRRRSNRRRDRGRGRGRRSGRAHEKENVKVKRRRERDKEGPEEAEEAG
jgi:hypothetical protein